MLHTKIQAPESSGSEEEDFLIYLYPFLWFESRTPWPGAILDPGTFVCTHLVKVQQAMLHTTFLAPDPSSSGDEDF